MSFDSLQPGDILEIIRMGHPVLREVALPVSSSDLGTPAFRKFGQALIETMFHAQGVGLAAPQVAEGLRCFTYYVPGEDEDGSTDMSPKVLVNPEIKPVNDIVQIGFEGCLSIPAIRGEVPRHHAIEVSALDIDGNPLNFVAEGFHATVIQHEYDHLDGILFLDRMESMESLSFEREWIQYQLGVDPSEFEDDSE